MTANSETASAASTSPTDSGAASFYPPKQSPLMTRLVQSISVPLARLLYKFKIEVSEADIAKVKAIDHARIVLVSNHPTMEDGISLFVLSARLGEIFHYIVAYESFKGLMGWFIQKMGCYSIRRGMGDRTSISQTLGLLKEPQCRLVIFPEGGCSYQNDTIMPFRSGAIQLPMAALAQLAKKATSPAQIPDLYLVPLSLKYRYLQPMEQVIDATLTRLENALGLNAPSQDAYQRLRQVAHVVLVRIENEAALPHSEDMSWNQRIDRLRQVFIHKCETALGLEPVTGLPIRERVYKVQALLEDKGESAIEDEAGHPEPLYWDTVRLLNFDAIYDGYVAESPTPERFLDTLTRLEREVFHQEHSQPKAQRRACFRIGDPINLKDFLAAYKRDRTDTVEQLSEQLRQLMQNNLDDMT